MNKPQKVRKIYSELKNVFGDEIPSHEVLEFAATLVAASEDSLYEPKTRLGAGGPTPYSEMSVDQVIESCPWKVVSRECVWEDDFMPYVPKQLLIEQCLAFN